MTKISDMTSQNKKAKTDKRKHWGRGGNFLKDTNKLKRLNFYNSSLRRKIKIVEDVILENGEKLK